MSVTTRPGEGINTTEDGKHMTCDWSEYQGKNVVVTGAASGMGAAVTRLLKDAGANITAWDIKEADETGLTMQRCDLTSLDSIETALDALDDPIDCFFGCAGLPQTFPAPDVVTVNFLANRHIIERLVPKMAKDGAMATIASLPLGWMENFALISQCLATSSFREGRQWVEAHVEDIGDPYVFSKHALVAYTTLESPRIMAQGVRLNTLCPGKTDTPMLEDFRKAVPEALDMLPMPMGRDSTPEEQAHAMLFLNSPRASYVTGAALCSDGGAAAALLGGALQQQSTG